MSSKPRGWYFLVAAFWASAFLMAVSVQAGTIVDNFNDNAINPTLWQGYSDGGPSVAETNQRLEITLPATSSGSVFSAGYKSLFSLTGDFDMQVDYELLTWPTPENGVRVGLVVAVGAVERVSGEWGNEVYLTDFGGTITPVTTTDTAGTLRLLRSGATMSGYFWNQSSSAWQLIASRNIVNNLTTVSLAAWSHDYCFGDKDVKVAFDNFKVTGPQVVPLPPAALLLASGLVGLGLARRKLW